MNTPSERAIRITSTYEAVTYESAENGEADERGWADEDGQLFDPKEHEGEEDPEQEAVDAAIAHLYNEGANEPSSSRVSPHTWWSATDPVVDYSTGANTYYAFHLSGPDDLVMRVHMGLLAKIGRR